MLVEASEGFCSLRERGCGGGEESSRRAGLDGVSNGADVAAELCYRLMQHAYLLLRPLGAAGDI